MKKSYCIIIFFFCTSFFSWAEVCCDDYKFAITKKEAYALSCEKVTFDVFVTDSKTRKAVVGQRVQAFYNRRQLILESNNLITNEDGKVELTFSRKDKTKISDEIVRVQLFKNNKSIQKSVIHYVPFKFHSPELHVIAGQLNIVSTKVLTCDSDSSIAVVDDYIGTPEVGLSIESPINGEDDIHLLKFFPSFKKSENGISNDRFILNESGQFMVTLSDFNFNCIGLNGCPDKGEGELKGSFLVQSRPWTFAICDSEGRDLNGNITDVNSAGFVAAGEFFSLRIKPILWKRNESVPVNTNRYCNRKVTRNFFLDDGSGLAIDFTSQVAEPAGGSNGSLIGVRSILHTDKSSNGDYYELNNIAWNEVGVLRLFADADRDYLTMDIDQSYRNIGRFYPAYFNITDTAWDYPAYQGSTDGSFIYMNQYFEDVNFEVTAYALDHDNKSYEVKNYGSFIQGLKAYFSLVGEYAHRLNILDSDLDNRHWNSGVWSTNDLQNIIAWEKVESQSEPYTTMPDGPFNSNDSNSTALSLKVLNDYDPATFIREDDQKDTLNDELELLEQPEIRYGRMTLGSVGGAINSIINVPIKIEYWNGNSFTISEGDNATVFNGTSYCRENIWREGRVSKESSDQSRLSGSGAVSNGINTSTLKAFSDDNDLREQIRFWLKLARNNNLDVNCSAMEPNVDQEWLRYNWLGNGDEDPSAVVTFGVYRGNDRILFRRERNIIGTLN